MWAEFFYRLLNFHKTFYQVYHISAAILGFIVVIIAARINQVRSFLYQNSLEGVLLVINK